MNYYVLNSIEFGPQIIKRIYRQIESSKYDQKPQGDRFTLREAIAHLVDWEPIFRGRMESILREPGCTILGQDASERALQNRYWEQDTEANLSRFVEERAITAQLIRSLGTEDWSKLGKREGYGAMTVEDFANLLVCHDMYHIEQASEYLLE